MQLRGVTGTTRLYGVIGLPVEHSLSPLIHNFLFRRHAIDAWYVPLPVSRSAVGRLIDVLKVTSFHGLNVTTPHKEFVARRVPSVAEEVRVSGGANTLVRRGRRWRALSTDGSGLCRFLEDELRCPLEGKRIVVLGAGPAARSVVLAAARRSPLELVVINRSAERLASPVVRRLVSRTSARALDVSSSSCRRVLARAQVVIHASSGPGHDGGWELDALTPETVAVDCNYGAAGETPFLSALPRGVAAYDGRGMLRWQALESFRHWIGIEVTRADAIALRHHMAKLDSCCGTSI